MSGVKMNSLTAPAVDHDQEDARVFADLLEQVGAAVERGDSAAAEAVIGAHPEYAERLRRILPAIQALAAFEEPDASSTGRSPADLGDAPDRTLGDFRIRREVGRGGMGVVYEAEQISLGRRVALKVLPYASLLDARQLERFKNEARVAAGLHHTNIVPVYTVGSDRGVYYYAMQFIEGRDLADVVQQLRAGSKEQGARSKEAEQQRSSGVDEQTTNYSTTPLLHSNSLPQSAIRNSKSEIDTAPIAALPTLHSPSSSLSALSSRERFRTVAEWIATAADALAYAHSLGVLHRDIKPANLLIDQWGTIWISDFGLARIECDAGMTMTGDVLGTLRYMSPELALGDHASVNARTDIYALGVTLYELLTLQPAFNAADRRQLLRQINEEEPLAPRRIDPTIPADLETIVLKAMEKDAADRYSSAGELAADLRRYLEDRPVVARPPSIATRMRKWLWRHSTAVVATVGTLLLAVIGLSIGTLMLNAQKNEAEANLRLAAQAVDQLLAEMGREAGAYGQLPQAERILQQAAGFYEQLIEKSDDPAILLRAATAHNHIGWLYRTELGRQELAIQKHQAALALLGRVDTRQNPTEKLLTRAIAYDGIGAAYMGINNSLAESHLNQARAIWEQLSDSNPGNIEYLGELIGTMNSQAVIYLDSSRLDDAEFTYRLILELSTQLPPPRSQTPNQLNTIAGVTCNLGTVAVELGRLAEAEPLFREAITKQEKVIALKSGVKAYEHDLYKFQWNLVDLFVRQGKHAAASAAAEKLIERFPNRLQAYYEAADLLLRCAETADTTKHTSAELSTTDTVQRYRAVARRLIAGADHVKEQTPDCLERFAWFLVMCKETSFRDPARALALADVGLAEAPQRHSLHEVRSMALYRLGQYQAAVHALEQSAAPRSKANIVDMLILAMSYWQLGNQKEAREWYAAGTEWFAKHQAIRPSVYDIYSAARGEILAEAKVVLGVNKVESLEQK
jgi:serine/threonine protein kinase